MEAGSALWLSVGGAAVGDAEDQDDQLSVSDFVHDAVVTEADAPDAVLPRQVLDASRAGIVAERVGGFLDPRGDIPR